MEKLKNVMIRLNIKIQIDTINILIKIEKKICDNLM